MRVTTGSTYRNFTSSVNDVHLKLNKSMNKITTGAAYEKAADNPLAYYIGQKIDSQYQDTITKNTLLTDVKNRLYQQELGVRDIQLTLSRAKTQVQYGRTATTTGEADIQTIKEDLMQKVRTIANDLNTQYQDFYVYGGNDVTTTPFALDIDLENREMTLTYSHTFPGEDKITNFEFKLAKDQTTGDYKFELQPPIDPNTNQPSTNQADITAHQDKLVKAMSEQGRIDIGYGSINDRDTLLDTYTGGLNVLTGYNSDAVRSMAGSNGVNNAAALKNIMEGSNGEYGMDNSAIALIGKAVFAIEDYQESGDKEKLDDMLASTIDGMTTAERTLSTTYSDLGNKSKVLDETATRLDSIEDSLNEQYKDTLGADPYAAIMEMFNNQYSYNAALQVGSKLMSTSLFDFVR